MCLTRDDVRKALCLPGLRLSLDARLCPYFEEKDTVCFGLDFPARISSLPALVRSLSLVEVEEDTYFGGAFLWFDLWSIGSPQLDKIGWATVERMRLSYGEMRSLEVAPAQRFREDESTQLQAFLFQAFAFQWDATVVYSRCDRFVHVSHDGYVVVVASSKEIRDNSWSFLEGWGPREVPDDIRARFCRPVRLSSA
jgi:hypothetical protein